MQALVAAAPQQISMFGVDEASERHQAIITHAIAAIQQYIQMRDSALRLCVSLYLCHQEFKNSGETGWQAFCDANFAQLGLSQGNIRSAVKAGRAVSHYMATLKDRGEAAEVTHLESMSRSALIVLGEAPDDVRDELIDRVVNANEMHGSSMSAREVEQELARVRQEKLLAERGQAEAIEKLSATDQALNRLNNLVRDRDNQVGALQSQIDALQFQLRQAPKAPDVVVEDPDPNTKAAQEARRNLERQVGELKHQLTQVEADLGREKAELDRLSRQAAMRKQSMSAIEELEQLVTRMKAQWSDAYAQKIRAQDVHTYGPILTRVANEMRFLADQLDPTLV